MPNFPLSIVSGLVVSDNKILLVKRMKQPFFGFYSFPGGKVELNEHVSEAAVRETFEETGLQCEFKKLRAIISEKVMEKNEIRHNWIFHVCELTPITTNLVQKETEDQPEWFNISELGKIKDRIIPREFEIIKLVLSPEKFAYVHSIQTKQGNVPKLEKFEKLT